MLDVSASAETKKSLFFFPVNSNNKWYNLVLVGSNYFLNGIIPNRYLMSHIDLFFFYLNNTLFVYSIAKAMQHIDAVFVYKKTASII